MLVRFYFKYIDLEILLLANKKYIYRAGMEYRIKPFVTAVESSHLPIAWAKWKRDLEAYFEAEKVESQFDKRSKLLYLGGSDLREIYDNLPETEKVTLLLLLLVYQSLIFFSFLIMHYSFLKVSYVLEDPPFYDAAIAKLDAHFEPFRRRNYERHQFRQISQKPSERLADFVLRLRAQVKRCEYEKLDEMILDQIVEKCASNKLRQKMLKRDMSLEEVEALGTSLEESEKQLKDFGGTVTGERINRVWKQPMNPRAGWNRVTQRGSRTSSSRGRSNPVTTFRPATVRSEPVCFACGRRGHVIGEEFCPAKEAICLQCRSVGHFARQ